MASWSAIEVEAPELTALAREFLDAFVHKTLATLRRDGSPRISGGQGGPGPSHLFRCDITELVVVSLPDPPEFLVIEAWHEGRGVTRRKRR